MLLETPSIKIELLYSSITLFNMKNNSREWLEHDKSFC